MPPRVPVIYGKNFKALPAINTAGATEPSLSLNTCYKYFKLTILCSNYPVVLLQNKLRQLNHLLPNSYLSNNQHHVSISSQAKMPELQLLLLVLLLVVIILVVPADWNYAHWISTRLVYTKSFCDLIKSTFELIRKLGSFISYTAFFKTKASGLSLK